LHDADGISLEITGDVWPLADEAPERNLAYRAAVAFRARAGIRRGVHITLEKRVPVAAGLGGGSSDAAAVLRGLNTLWQAGQPELNLVEIAGEIGSDPPSFVLGGTVDAQGRGDSVSALPDAIAPLVVIATPPAAERGEKTASMYGALTPDDFTEGDATVGVREAIMSGHSIDDSMLTNVFERVVAEMQPDTANAMNALRAQGCVPHLCGAGPSFFLLVPTERDAAAVGERIAELGFEQRTARTLSRADELHIESA
jgi:4-diphosphocytidyl-2-C-methyl-D-erythritol kinase